MNLFFKDLITQHCYTWGYLIDELNRSSTYNPFCKSENYYEVFKHIILSLVTGNEITLLDADFSDAELEQLTGFTSYEKFNKAISIKNSFKDKEALMDGILNASDNWKVTLFTSGTTGKPKKISHSFESISRFVKRSDRNAQSVWGFAYNPTHMAGLQVFFQALLNGNPIIRLFGLGQEQILQEIKENNISHISATPTFYKLLLPCQGKFDSVKRITSGGEKFSEPTMKQLMGSFPNAKITNVYASTEAGTLLASENEVFSIKPEYEHLIRIENNELQIHNSLMGNTSTELQDWYRTGDLIEVITHAPLKFRFVSRLSDMINVGGYKVNPIEVEDAILLIPEVQNARVFPKKNSLLGNIVCCEVVSKDDRINDSSIRIFLQSKIQAFKIPRIIKFVDELSVTRTGKIKRN